MNLSTYILYGVTILFLIFSYMKDKKKTKMSLKKAWKAFENILPEFLVVILFVGVLLAVLNPDAISKIIGSDSGWLGVMIAAVVGAITLIPGFVAFPTAAMLLQSGAGYMQIGAFVSTLMMVGIVTMPVEIKYFGKKLTILRNVLAFGFSFVVAYIIGLVVSGI
ncbi:MAG: putative permease [Clostridia bacterium]|nr:putative permease [Clostridia bacterium]